MSGEIDRRQALWLLAAGCTSAPLGQAIVPYVKTPPEWVPGVPMFAATSLVEDGFAIGVLAECHDGRPTKLEGNPDHPASLGATGARDQAAVLELYDPARLDGIHRGPVPTDRNALAQALQTLPPGGEGLHLLLEPSTSPSIRAALDRVLERWPRCRVHTHAILDARAPLDGARIALGAPLIRKPDLSAADVVVAFDADPLEGPWAVRNARDLAGRRRPGQMSRLWVAESDLTPFGARSDRRIALRPSEIPVALLLLAAEILPGIPEVAASEEARAFARAAAAELQARRGAVLVGTRQPPWTHALALLLDQTLGSPVSLLPSPLLEAEDLEALLLALDQGSVDTLVILDGDPASGTADRRLPERLRAARRVFRLGLWEDQTSAIADWRIAALHGLERWGAARAFDGTLSTVQPVLRPLVSGLAPEELLADLAGISGFDLQAHVRAAVGSDAAWARGLVEGSAPPPISRPVDQGAVMAAISPPWPSVGLEIGFSVDPRVYDGRYLRNAWLQELPDPITQVAWGDAARIGPETAKLYRVEEGAELSLSKEGRELTIPAVILPGHPEGSVTVSLGYGPGVDRLRSGARPWRDDGIILRRIGRGTLAVGQGSASREGREVARSVALSEVGALRPEEEPLRPWRPFPAKWGMAIDLSACLGCNACAVACQAENNVPTVGPTEFARGRRMHWLRIDRYQDAPGQLTFQPMLCQHCEDAPCEYVCPVYATVHSSDGLNEQVYNRCVGTRFCSENCPYKVRRFNWFDHSPGLDDRTRLQLNPDVTVRERGVIEKCTFCVQRIREGERVARIEGRALRDGEVITACAQACPTGAIVFGPSGGEIEELHADPRAYSELGELGTRPRVRYLVSVRNPPEGA